MTKATDDKVLAALNSVDTSRIRTPNELDKTVSNLMDFVDEMNEWEYDFVNDMAVRVKQGGGLSKKQIEQVEKLERKYL